MGKASLSTNALVVMYPEIKVTKFQSPFADDEVQVGIS